LSPQCKNLCSFFVLVSSLLVRVVLCFGVIGIEMNDMDSVPVTGVFTPALRILAEGVFVERLRFANRARSMPALPTRL